LPAGEHEIVIERPGYETVRSPLEVVPDEMSTIVFELQRLER
jgi:hypothetical protein